jgi:hypothetical protein
MCVHSESGNNRSNHFATESLTPFSDSLLHLGVIQEEVHRIVDRSKTKDFNATNWFDLTNLSKSAFAVAAILVDCVRAVADGLAPLRSRARPRTILRNPG